MGFDFSQTSSFRLNAKNLGYVTLSKKTWDHVIKERDREHAKYNEQLIKETLQNPDNIKQSDDDPSVYLYIKKTQEYRIRPDITVDMQRFRYFTIVVQKDRRFIITIYPSSVIIGGKQIWPRQSQK